MSHERTGEVLQRGEVVRLMIQALRDYGYVQTASQLETESKIPLESAPVVAFRDAVLQGLWMEVEGLLSKLQIALFEEQKLRNVQFLIRRQKFLELLEQRQVKEALVCLRNEIAPVQDETSALSKLTSFMMCTDVEELKSRAHWDGAAGRSRSLLLQELRKFIPPSLMIPERRLESLLLQAVDHQRSSCIYHNLKDETINLFEDHSCDRSQIPRETKRVLVKHTDEVWHVQFSHNGRFLASASKDGTAIIWDIQTYQPLHVLVGHSQALSYLAWSPDDSTILSCSNDHTVRLWSSQTGECLHVYTRHSECVAACAWLPDGIHFISGGQDKNLLMMNINGTEVKRWTCTRVQDLAVTGDGKTLIVICQEKLIRLYPIEGDVSESDSIPEVDNITSLALSADSRYVTVNLSSQEIHMWELEKKSLVQHYRGHKQGRFVIRSCFGGASQAFVVSGSEDSNVYLWHKIHGTLLEVLSGHTLTVNSISWSPTDPCLLASASDDTTIRLWGPAAPDSAFSPAASPSTSPGGLMDLAPNGSH